MPAVRLRTVPRSPALDGEEWTRRHRVASGGLGALASIVVIWSALVDHSAAQLLLLVLPLALLASLASMRRLSHPVREVAVVVGLLSASAIIGGLAGDSLITPAGYAISVCLAALYERRRMLALALALVVAHELLFGTVVPDGRSIAGLPGWATSLGFAGAFVVAAAAMVVPWAENRRLRRLSVRQAALIADQLAVSEIVIAVDALGRVTLISDHGLKVLGLDRDAVIGEDFFGLVVSEDRIEAARAGHRNLIAAGAELAAPAFYEFEHAIRTAGGERRIFLWRVTVSMDGGAPSGTVASGFDITEVRRAQRQLQRDHRDLEQLQRLARAVAREADARDAVVSGIRTLVDGRIAALIEPSPSGDEAVISCCTDPSMLGVRFPLDGSPSGTSIVLATAEPFFVADAEGHPLINQEIRRQTGSSSFIYHPVMLEGRVAAVISVGWEDRVAEIGDRRARLVALAAEEAASALARVAATRQLEEAALTDVLTGIPNRRAFDQLYDRALEDARETGRPLSLALMDLNAFKQLNDSEGHAAGDRVLKESASLWHGELRPTDVIARLGGDEFVALLPNCGRGDAESVAGRLRRALRHEAGCGVGVAVWDGKETGTSLMRRADEALYADKARDAVSRITDAARVAAVERTGFLGKGHSDPRLDALADTVSSLLHVPLSLVSLLDSEEQTFVGKHGLEVVGIEDPTIPWAHSYCRHPVATGRPLVVNDVATHVLVANEDIPVPDEVTVGAYAGFPIIDEAGHVVGSMCAVDTAPRDWTTDELATLRSVAARATQIIVDDARAAPETSDASSTPGSAAGEA